MATRGRPAKADQLAGLEPAQRLMVAIARQAIEDARGHNELRRAEAREWLRDPVVTLLIERTGLAPEVWQRWVHRVLS